MKFAAKILLTLLLASTAIVSIGVDWNDSHVFHPDWHQHAKFHDIVLLIFLAGMCLTATWMMWRKSHEPGVAVCVATGVVCCFWGAFFVAASIPGSSPAAHIGEEPANIAGIPLYTNMIIATAQCVLAIIAAILFTRGSNQIEDLDTDIGIGR